MLTQVKNNMQEFLEHLNANFKYHYDKDLYGKRESWHIMYHLPFEGDCEDYALTYLYEASGRSHAKMLWHLFTGKAKICFCKFKGQGHAVLRWDGKYIDNIQKKFCTKEYMEKRFYEFHKSWFTVNVVTVKLLKGYLYARKRPLRG